MMKGSMVADVAFNFTAIRWSIFDIFSIFSSNCLYFMFSPLTMSNPIKTNKLNSHDRMEAQSFTEIILYSFRWSPQNLRSIPICLSFATLVPKNPSQWRIVFQTWRSYFHIPALCLLWIWKMRAPIITFAYNRIGRSHFLC